MCKPVRYWEVSLDTLRLTVSLKFHLLNHLYLGCIKRTKPLLFSTCYMHLYDSKFYFILFWRIVRTGSYSAVGNSNTVTVHNLCVLVCISVTLRRLTNNDCNGSS